MNFFVSKMGSFSVFESGMIVFFVVIAVVAMVQTVKLDIEREKSVWRYGDWLPTKLGSFKDTSGGLPVSYVEKVPASSRDQKVASSV